MKKASPSKGVIQPNFDPVRIAAAYEAGGAACLSVLTDEKFFQGSFDNLTAIKAAGVGCPLLCKEFVVEAYQIFKARVAGADAVLLIAAVLPNQVRAQGAAVSCVCLAGDGAGDAYRRTAGTLYPAGTVGLQLEVQHSSGHPAGVEAGKAVSLLEVW